ncbi:hypothetical protein Tco_1551062, partial [Tanacetum coccineum]
IVDDDARTKDSAQLETPISESDKENVDVIGSTFSRKDTRNGNLDIYVFTTSLTKIHEPTTYLEAVKDSRWVVAMNQEMEALNRNKT